MNVHVGQQATRSLTLTADHVRQYASMSGDFNPLHFDEAFAARTPFKRLVVQGGLTTGSSTRSSPWTCPGRERCS